MRLKIAVLGAASSYTPELFANLIDLTREIEVEQIVLMDPDLKKLSLIAKVCQHILDGSGMKINIRTTTDHLDAIKGMDFIIMQIRVGGLAGRVRDEKLPMEFDLVGNETTGAGGFISALRTLPVVLKIARDIERLAPQAWLLNLTNPAGILTEAILKHSRVRTVGFCNIPINTQYAFSEVLQVSPSKVCLNSFGLNHLSWVWRVIVDGQDRLQPLIEAVHDREAALYRYGLVEPLIDPGWLRALQMIPGWYLRYFYYPEQVIEEDRGNTKTDGERDILAEGRLHKIYSTQGYTREAQQILEEKGGAQYYLPVLQAIDSIVNNRGEVIIADVRNGDAMPELPPEACVELPARFTRDSVEALPVTRLPLCVRGLVQAVKVYEELTIEAAITGDRGTALAAMVTHPLVGSFPKAEAFFERALRQEQAFLPQFLSKG